MQGTRRATLGALATLGLGAGAGCLSSLTASAAGETALGVVVDGAPNGLQKYAVELSAPATVEAVTPKLIVGPQFQVTEGGAGHRRVAFRGADFVRTVGAFEGKRTLAVVRFAEAVRFEETTLSVATLVDDDGTEMDHGRVRVDSGEE